VLFWSGYPVIKDRKPANWFENLMFGICQEYGPWEHGWRHRTEGARRRTDENLTTASRSFRYPESARAFDVRCSAGLPDHRESEGRCQLFAGHDGPHAVMFARGSGRFVRTWRTSTRNGRTVDADDGQPAGPAALQRPWMFGFPTPAWFEDELAESPTAELSG
jgi:hypothetical protein